MSQDPDAAASELIRTLSPLSASSDGSWVALNGEYSSRPGGASSTGVLLPELGRPGLINAQEQSENESIDLSDADDESSSSSSILTLLMSPSVRLPLLVASNLMILALGLFLGRRAFLSLDASMTL